MQQKHNCATFGRTVASAIMLFCTYWATYVTIYRRNSDRNYKLGFFTITDWATVDLVHQMVLLGWFDVLCPKALRRLVVAGIS